MNIDFAQFGVGAILFIGMSIVVAYLVGQNKEERGRTDEQIKLRMIDQKEAKESSDKTSNELLILTRQIYNVLTNNPAIRRD